MHHPPLHFRTIYFYQLAFNASNHYIKHDKASRNFAQYKTVILPAVEFTQNTLHPLAFKLSRPHLFNDSFNIKHASKKKRRKKAVIILKLHPNVQWQLMLFCSFPLETCSWYCNWIRVACNDDLTPLQVLFFFFFAVQHYGLRKSLKPSGFLLDSSLELQFFSCSLVVKKKKNTKPDNKAAVWNSPGILLGCWIPACRKYICPPHISRL